MSLVPLMFAPRQDEPKALDLASGFCIRNIFRIYQDISELMPFGIIRKLEFAVDPRITNSEHW